METGIRLPATLGLALLCGCATVHTLSADRVEETMYETRMSLNLFRVYTAGS